MLRIPWTWTENAKQHGPSGYFPNYTHEAIMEDIELGHRVSRAQEDEDLGFGPLFDLQYKMWCDLDKLK